MRALGVVLLVLGAFIVVPALVYAAYLRLDAWRDPAGLKAYLALVVAGLGACVGAIGGAAAYVGWRDGPRSR